MTIFGCENAANGFFFRNLHEKLGKMGKKISWSYGGQKWSHLKIDRFTKNGPKSSILSIFHRGKAQNDEN